jgi:hypothetical protein
MRLTDEQIATELRALRPEIEDRFAAELDAWAAAGFPEKQDTPTVPGTPRTSLWPAFLTPPLRWRRLVPAIGALAILVVVIGVVISIDYDRVQDSGGGGEALSGDQAIPESTPEPGRAAQAPPGEAIAPTTAVPPVPPSPDEQLKPGRERVQEQSASLALSTEPDQVDEVADGVVEVTDRYEGIVVSSDVNTSDGRGRATFDLRIPAQSLQAALSDLSDLAHVSSRDEGLRDITAPFVSAEERFGDAKAEVDSLLDQLADADSPAEVASIREQLRLARQELAAARSTLGALKQRSDFSRLSVTVVGDGDGDGWSIGDAAGDAVDVLEALGGAALIALAVLAPLALLGYLGWRGFSTVRRRRRESTLDD